MQARLKLTPFPARFEVTPFYALRTNPLPPGALARFRAGARSLHHEWQQENFQ